MGKIKRETMKGFVELLKDLKAKVKKGSKLDWKEKLIVAGLIGQRVEDYENVLASNRPIYWEPDWLKGIEGRNRP